MTHLRSFLGSVPYSIAAYVLLAVYALLFLLEPEKVIWWYSLVYTIVVGLLVADVILRLAFVRPTKWISEQGFWLVFDVVTTFLAFLPGYEPFRALRFLRLLSQWEATRSTITPLGVAVWEARQALAIVAVLMFTNTVIAYDAFKVALPELFGTVPGALLTSVSLVIGDNFRDTYGEAFSIHAPVAIFHIAVSLFTLLFILGLILYKVFKSFEDLLRTDKS